MTRKILAFCVALVALAIVPASAFASPELQTSTGTKVATGTAINGALVSGTESVLSGSLGTVKCNEGVLTGEVTENSGTSIKGTIKTATFHSNGGNCTSNVLGFNFQPMTVQVTTFLTNEGGTKHWCLATSKLGSGSIVGGACGGTAEAVTFVLDFFEGTTKRGECHYSTASVAGTYNTASSPLILKVTNQSFTGTGTVNGIACGNGTLSMETVLTTSSGGALKIV